MRACCAPTAPSPTSPTISFEELQAVVDALPEDPADYPDLRIGDQGIKRKRWYVEGYERFDEHGGLVRCDPKGIEIRTRIHPSVDGRRPPRCGADLALLDAEAARARPGGHRDRRSTRCARGTGRARR